MNVKIDAADAMSAGLDMKQGVIEQFDAPRFCYVVECISADGEGRAGKVGLHLTGQVRLNSSREVAPGPPFASLPA